LATTSLLNWLENLIKKLILLLFIATFGLNKKVCNRSPVLYVNLIYTVEYIIVETLFLSF